MQAIILAGGSAMPLRPLTARQPRSLVPLVNQPLVVHQINMLKKHGVSDVILCIDHQADQFERYFSLHSFDDVTVRLHMDERPKGTAGALKSAQSLLTSDEFAISYRRLISPPSSIFTMKNEPPRQLRSRRRNPPSNTE
jgi:mannose-1-phosphate guanylyltransferase/phosphomannomutase